MICHLIVSFCFSAAYVFIMDANCSLTKSLVFFTVTLIVFFVYVQVTGNSVTGVWYMINGRRSNNDDSERFEVEQRFRTFHAFMLKKGVPELLLRQIEQANFTNQEMKKYFHKNWYLKPSKTPYRLTADIKREKYFSEDNQDIFVDNYFKNMTNGIFFEVGAADGVLFSNTLYLKRERNWTGVLIEPNRHLYNSLVSIRRKSYTINSCASLDESISVVNFLPAMLLGGILKNLKEQKLLMNRVKLINPNIKPEKVLCVPLKSIAEAIGTTHIHFLSLDVEGAELEVLKTIPLSQIIIDLIMVDYFVPNSKTASQKRLNEYRRFFKELKIYKEVFCGKNDVGFAKQNIT